MTGEVVEGKAEGHACEPEEERIIKLQRLSGSCFSVECHLGENLSLNLERCNFFGELEKSILVGVIGTLIGSSKVK